MRNMKSWIFWGLIAALVASLCGNALTLYYLGEEERSVDSIGAIHLVRPMAPKALAARVR